MHCWALTHIQQLQKQIWNILNQVTDGMRPYISWAGGSMHLSVGLHPSFVGSSLGLVSHIIHRLLERLLSHGDGQCELWEFIILMLWWWGPTMEEFPPHMNTLASSMLWPSIIPYDWLDGGSIGGSPLYTPAADTIVTLISTFCTCILICI